ncbi:MAG: putative membrane protein, partial [Urechidicola sp.]
SLTGLNLEVFKVLKNDGLKAFWEKINGSFLLSLFLGIFISLMSLAKVITHVLEVYPIATWAFFFGLIVASAIYIGRKITQWRAQEIIAVIIGAGIAYGITIAPAMQGPEQLWFIFISGCIAICAMILPGISGSFILLLLGSYKTILGALGGITDNFKENITTILVFGAGCIVGLLTFSRLVSYAFEKARSVTMAVLTGFMIGSLNKVWPWKKVISRRVDSHGEIKPFLEASVSPDSYALDTGLPTEITMALVMAIIGFALVFILGMFDKEKEAVEHSK